MGLICERVGAGVQLIGSRYSPHMRRSLLLVLLIGLGGMVGRATAAAQSLAITHVNIIDTTGGPTQRDMVVVVTSWRIVQVAKADRAHPPKGAQTVDGR